MMISDVHRFAYSGITKTATQTTFKVLRDHYCGYFPCNSHMHGRHLPPHAANYFKFTTVRHPFSRVVSLWWSTTQRGDDKYGFRGMCPNPDDFASFAQWLATEAPEHELTRTQSEHINGFACDAVLRFESLAADFARLPFYSGKPVEWPRENETIGSRQRWPAYMTPEAAIWVRQWAGQDFDRFGYSSELHQ